MLRYHSDISEVTLTDGRGTQPIRQVVLFFYRDDGNGLHCLRDEWDRGIFEYEYSVIRIWEEASHNVYRVADPKIIM
jgi:hypothetical protein